ncbi:hypothetical protein TRFO_22903 [Tritrichomonas foetus]|uniref:Uncharacterized protein n=1 Tax=Tritrichomonas foetus TaxID=1144522 RepID=A0A1J4KAV6_9EUKA|nr:hypothetical protein TRFO_22903 [Tritrichomonas foetus]|eukprot:OHT08559.1 hypothetical protein TRFO_22903 [Tritrichomonas foetus]
MLRRKANPRKKKNIATIISIVIGTVVAFYYYIAYTQAPKTVESEITTNTRDGQSTKMISSRDDDNSIYLDESSDGFVSSLKWRKNWWEDSHFTNPQIKRTTEKCQLCDFKPTQINSTSSDQDVIITVAIDKIYGLPTTIRSIRTSGIKSSIIVMADSVASKEIRDNIQNVIDDCGVIVIDVGDMTRHQMKGRYRTRWHLVYDYFRLNPLNFKRFIMTDAYDSFFQGDPFLGSVQDDSLYFSTESINIGKCQHNSGWIKEIYPNSLSDMKSKPIICAGPVAGGVQPLLKFCRIMFGLDKWEGKWTKPPDQAYVNYVVRTKMLDEQNITYKVIPNDGFMTTVGYCDRKGSLFVDENGNVGCPGFNAAPMLIHQYVRPMNMRVHMYKVCNSTIPHSFKRDPYSKASF